MDALSNVSVQQPLLVMGLLFAEDTASLLARGQSGCGSGCCCLANMEMPLPMVCRGTREKLTEERISRGDWTQGCESGGSAHFGEAALS